MQGAADTASDTGSVAPMVSRVMHRAMALVTMAQSAAAAAPNSAAARRAAVAAADAAAAYATALASYSAGLYAAATPSARNAIRSGEIAVALVLEEHPDLLASVSTGEVEAPALFAPPAATITAAVNPAPLRVPSSYAEVRSLPFGTVPAGPGAPPLRDSLPFGVVPTTSFPSSSRVLSPARSPGGPGGTSAGPAYPAYPAYP